MTDPQYRPRLRPHLAAGRDGDHYVLYDPLHIGEPTPISSQELEIVQRLTGRMTAQELRSSLLGTLSEWSDEAFTALLRRLDEALLLDGPALQQLLAAPNRRPSCIGCYPEDPEQIRQEMKKLFLAPGGAGLPAPELTTKKGRLRAALLPHMDYARGNITYGWGFREVFEQTDARLFVIIATSHYSPALFTLTRQNFVTPLGVVPTDQNYIDRLVKHYGPGLFSDPMAHLPEHSIELEVLVLQYLYEARGPIRIVPLLVGSFEGFIDAEVPPHQHPQVARMIQALRFAEEEAEEPVCYIISGDLAHIGPKFDDPEPVRAPWLNQSRSQDELLLERLGQADVEGYYQLIAEEANARRICGLSPTYLTLHVARPQRGRVLHYQQYVHPTGHESVSFAAATFHDG